MMSSPGKSAKTKAGLRFEPDKSENGNGNTTTSPFINPPMRYLLQVLTNLLQGQLGWHNGFEYHLLF